MDFSLSEEQEAVRDLARQIFSGHVTHERLLALTRSGEWFDMDLWSEIAKANLPGVALPESVGGSGFGPVELCLLLEEVGRHVAPVPLLATSVLGAAPIAEFGSDAQRSRWLRPVAEDGAVLTAALSEVGAAVPSRPRVAARRDGNDYRLDGVKDCVPAAHLAAGVLVPARVENGVGVFIVDPRGPGVDLERQEMTNGEPQSRLTLNGVRVPAADLLGDVARGAAIIDWLVLRATLGLAAIQVGVAEDALARTAEYVGERKQFGRPIAAFQGVALRAADAYIDVESLRCTVYQAAWRLSAGLDARVEVASAKWWAATAGMRVAHTAQHLHGGIGSDLEYPIHRYFLWAKQNELLFGGENQQLAQLGAHLVSDEWSRTEVR
jgi:alkylation response protein AidB-like acyl-CoA dehydrogenase